MILPVAASLKVAHREYYVRNITHALVLGDRSHNIVFRSVFYFPRLVDIKQCASHTIYVSVAGCDNAVVDQQPSLICFDRNRAGTDLGDLHADSSPRTGLIM